MGWKPFFVFVVVTQATLERREKGKEIGNSKQKVEEKTLAIKNYFQHLIIKLQRSTYI